MLLFTICEAPKKISTISWPFFSIFTLFHSKTPKTRTLQLTLNQILTPTQYVEDDLKILSGKSFISTKTT